MKPDRTGSVEEHQRQYAGDRAAHAVALSEFYREPEAVFWVFIFPILLRRGTGYRVSESARLRHRTLPLQKAPRIVP